MLAFLCIVLAVAVMALLSLSGSGWTIAMLALSGILYGVFSFVLFRWNHQLWPIVAPAVAFCLAIVSAALLRHKLPPFPKMAMEKGT